MASVQVMHSRRCLFHTECACVMTFSVCVLPKQSLLSIEKVKAGANQTESREQLLICQVFHKQTCIYLLTRFRLEVNLPFEQQEIIIEIDTIYNHLFLLNICYVAACLAHLPCCVFIYDKSPQCSFIPLLKVLNRITFICNCGGL